MFSDGGCRETFVVKVAALCQIFLKGRGGGKRNPTLFSCKLLAKILMTRLALSSTPLVYLWSSSIENPDALKTCLKLTISWHLLLICFVSDIHKSRKYLCPVPANGSAEMASGFIFLNKVSFVFMV